MIFALHGFLGLPSDWNLFDGAIRGRDGRPATLRKWNLYGDLPARPPAPDVYPLRIWARDFCQRVRSGWTAQGEGGKPVLMGYSMGGRLALHALLEDPDLWSCGVIVGAHPGLTSLDLRLQRRLNDARWAERFRTEDWSGLARAWGEQDVFKSPSGEASTAKLPRQEHDFDRALLARALQLWSLSNQEDLRLELLDLKTPALWLYGENDRRYRDLYRDLAMDLADNSAQVFQPVPGAGHRVPWDNPAAFIAQVEAFLNHAG